MPSFYDYNPANDIPDDEVYTEDHLVTADGLDIDVTVTECAVTGDQKYHVNNVWMQGTKCTVDADIDYLEQLLEAHFAGDAVELLAA